MTIIQKMLKDLCPSGVEWKPLAECCNILDTKRKPITKSLRDKGEYAYYGANGIQDYVSSYIFDGAFVLVGEDGSVLTKNDNPVVTWAEGKIWVNNHAHIISEKQGILLRYLYFYLQTINISNLVHGNIPKLTQNDFKNLSIPIPPLPVQQHIVNILDKFTTLQTQLQSALQTEYTFRKKQYEYYRDKLLTFDNNVEWEKVGDVCEVITGGEPPIDCIKNNVSIGLQRYPVYGNGNNVYGFSSTFKINKDAVAISSIGNVGTIHFYKANFTPITRLKVLIPKKNNLDVKFLFYALQTIEIKSKTSTLPNINSNEVKNLSIPVPSLSVQQHIVNILDKFDTYTNSLTKGLPAEIKLREKQYEYYRDLLLKFD